MDKSGFFNSFHRNSHGELKSTFFDPFVVKHRKRTSKSQLKILEKTFETNIKPDAILRNQLSEQLGMPPRSVQVWFQNRRAKQKKAKNKFRGESRENFNHNIHMGKYEHVNSMMPIADESMMFVPIATLEKPTMFCNDRYPMSPLHDKSQKNIANIGAENMPDPSQPTENKVEYPSVENLDTSWMDMQPNFEKDDGFSENTIHFDPNNFFC